MFFFNLCPYSVPFQSILIILYLGSQHLQPAMEVDEGCNELEPDEGGNELDCFLKNAGLEGPPSPDPCEPELLYEANKQLLSEVRRLKMQLKDEATLSLSQIKLLEYHNEQQQRFLDKQTYLVDVLERKRSDDFDGIEGLENWTSACPRCVYHGDMWRRLRSINLEQQKRCEVNSASMRLIQEQEGKQLALMKMGMMRLQTQYDELKRTKDDPYCRDSEILKLREEVVNAKALTAGFNKTAWNANNEARELLAQLDQEKADSSELRATIVSLHASVSLHQEMIEVLQHTASPSSTMAVQLFTIGQ